MDVSGTAMSATCLNGLLLESSFGKKRSSGTKSGMRGILPASEHQAGAFLSSGNVLSRVVADFLRTLCWTRLQPGLDRMTNTVRLAVVDMVSNDLCS